MAARTGTSRLALWLGGAAAAGGGYYLYRAGGNPRAAEKELEHDYHKLSSKAKSEFGAKEREARGQGHLTSKAAAGIDSTIDEAKAAVNRFDAKGENLRRDAEKKIEQYKGEINRDVHVAAEKFDRTVEQGAEKAKSTWKIWFGGK